MTSEEFDKLDVGDTVCYGSRVNGLVIHRSVDAIHVKWEDWGTGQMPRVVSKDAEGFSTFLNHFEKVNIKRADPTIIPHFQHTFNEVGWTGFAFQTKVEEMDLHLNEVSDNVVAANESIDKLQRLCSRLFILILLMIVIAGVWLIYLTTEVH